MTPLSRYHNTIKKKHPKPKTISTTTLHLNSNPYTHYPNPTHHNNDNANDHYAYDNLLHNTNLPRLGLGVEYCTLLRFILLKREYT